MLPGGPWPNLLALSPRCSLRPTAVCCSPSREAAPRVCCGGAVSGPPRVTVRLGWHRPGRPLPLGALGPRPLGLGA